MDSTKRKKKKKKPFIIPCYQGTSENAAFRVVTNGFGTTATLDDGFFGRGIYFTSDMKYAAKYAGSTKRGKVFLLSLVITGNAFPITEDPYKERPEGGIETTIDENGLIKFVPNPQGYLGKACRTGYQSHYTVVDSRTISTAFPFKEKEFNPSVTSNEVIVFDGSQILPLFLIYTTEFNAIEKANSVRQGPVKGILPTLFFLFFSILFS